MSVYVVSGRTESGDDWCLVFKKEPTDEMIKEAISKDPWLSEEWEAECIQGWDISLEKVIK